MNRQPNAIWGIKMTYMVEIQNRDVWDLVNLLYGI